MFKDLIDKFDCCANFVKVGVDKNANAARKYGVSSMPTFLFVKADEVVETVMGDTAARLQKTGFYKL